MKQHVADRQYGKLSARERFALLIEAMARQDKPEADRLEETCPRQLYRGEDRAFRERMIRAYMIASRVALDLEGGLAQLRLAQALVELGPHLAGPVACLAQAAFLHGREYAKWEAGAIDSIGLPDAGIIARQAAEDPELNGQLDELSALGQEALSGIAAWLSGRVCQVHAVDVLPRWEGFGRFCRQTLGMEPMVLMRAFGLRSSDVSAEVRAAWSDATVDDTVAGEWAAGWTQIWDRRFR